MLYEDPSLQEIVKAARGTPSMAGTGFFMRNGLIYRRWKPRRKESDAEISATTVMSERCYGIVTRNTMWRTVGKGQNY